MLSDKRVTLPHQATFWRQEFQRSVLSRYAPELYRALLFFVSENDRRKPRRARALHEARKLLKTLHSEMILRSDG